MYFFESENFHLFLDNLSIYHVVFDIISFMAFLLTLFFCRPGVIATKNLEKKDDSSSEEDLISQTMQNLKGKRQKDLLGQVSSNLSQNELEEEKRMEKMQLEKIFELLREQEEKFKVTSMEQVHDQLSLYR